MFLKKLRNPLGCALGDFMSAGVNHCDDGRAVGGGILRAHFAGGFAFFFAVIQGDVAMNRQLLLIEFHEGIFLAGDVEDRLGLGAVRLFLAEQTGDGGDGGDRIVAG